MASSHVCVCPLMMRICVCLSLVLVVSAAEKGRSSQLEKELRTLEEEVLKLGLEKANCECGQTSERGLFPYKVDDAAHECGTEGYCTAECGSSVYGADFTTPSGPCTSKNADDGCNLPTKLKALFIDFDGTLELYDDLADHVNDILGTWYDIKNGHGSFKKLKGDDPAGKAGTVDGKMMIAALDEVKDKAGATFAKRYFDDKPEGRMEKLKAALKVVKDAGVPVRIMSASWAPISGEAWAEYLEYLTKMPEVDLFNSFDSIESIPDPGGSTPGNKAAHIAELMGKNMTGVVHVDNSYKYLQQVINSDLMDGVSGSAGGLSPEGVKCEHIKKITDAAGIDGVVC